MAKEDPHQSKKHHNILRVEIPYLSSGQVPGGYHEIGDTQHAGNLVAGPLRPGFIWKRT